MAIGWLAVLKGVPWADVIGNAPIVVDGAKKLWNVVSKQTTSRRGPTGDTTLAPQIEPTLLEGRVGALEAALADLHAQMLASSELIKALADQNAQLIARIETHRRVLRGLALGTLFAAVLAAAGLWIHLAR